MIDPTQGSPAPQASSLTPRLIKGLQADYETAEWPGENNSGLLAIGDYVLVHTGYAISVLNKDEAEETLRLLGEIAAMDEVEG